MTTKIQKWGNSLAMRIPSRLAEQYGLKAGSRVRARDGMLGILIEPASKKEETLEDLIAQIDPNNLPEKIEWGKPVGNEIW